GERGQADGGDDLGERVGTEGSGLGGIGDRGRERTDRGIKSLRQRHQLGPLWQPGGAPAEPPNAPHRPGPRRLCRAPPAPGAPPPPPAAGAKARQGAGGGAGGHPHKRVSFSAASPPPAPPPRDRLGPGSARRPPPARDVKAAESPDPRPPLRERTIGVDEK